MGLKYLSKTGLTVSQDFIVDYDRDGNITGGHFEMKKDRKDKVIGAITGSEELLGDTGY